MLELAHKWVDEFKKNGKNVTLISMHTIKPFDTEAVLNIINKNIPIVTLEEHNIIGGLGSAAAEVIAESSNTVPFKRIAIQDQYYHLVGNQEFLRDKFDFNICRLENIFN